MIDDLGTVLATTDPLLLLFLLIEGVGAAVEVGWLARKWWTGRA